MELLNYSILCIYIIQAAAKCIEEELLHGNATLTTEPYFSIHYECGEGFELFGVADTYCFDSVWATPVPICYAKGCKADEYREVTNGDIDVVSEGALLVVKCKPGFIMDGKNILSCDGKHWSEPLPNCHSAVEIDQCDFEHNSFCGWTQNFEGYPDWEIHTGQTDTKRTGPTSDHTYGPERSNGHYIYMESSVPRQYGDISRLLSPVYPKQKSRRCFKLWYHMLGPEEPEYVGSLEILLRTKNVRGYIENGLYYVSGNQGDEWHLAEMFIDSQTTDFQIVVQATRGRYHVSDIAVDDFQFYKCTNDSYSEEGNVSFNDTMTGNGISIENRTASTEKQINSTERQDSRPIAYDVLSGGIGEVTQKTIKTTTHHHITLTTLPTESAHVNFKPKRQNGFQTYKPVVEPDMMRKPLKVEQALTSTDAKIISQQVITSTPKDKTIVTSLKPIIDAEVKTEAKSYSLQGTVETPTTKTTLTITENIILYPAVVGHPSNMSGDGNEQSKDDDKYETILAPTDPISGQGTRKQESIIFKPVFIAIVAGLCFAMLIAVIIITIFVQRRRRIWGRKTSDDQIRVLYCKNKLTLETSQNP